MTNVKDTWPRLEEHTNRLYGAAHIEADIGEVLERAPVTGITANGLALHIQAAIQGAFAVGKARNDPSVVRDSVAHRTRYVASLFGRQ